MAFGSLLSSSTAGSSGPGTVLELVALGAADVHLHVNARFTHWRNRVQKCTNFAIESVPQCFNGQVGWGQECSAKLNRTGDLVHWMYVCLEIPAIVATPTPSGAPACSQPFPCFDACDDEVALNDCKEFLGCSGLLPEENPVLEELDGDENCVGGLMGPFAFWVNEIGHAAVKRASFSIGGQLIETTYSQFLHAWEELAGQPGKRLEEMIGKRSSVAELVEDSQFDRILYVPLNFHFTRHTGNAMPLVSLQFHSMDVHVQFERLENLIQVSSCDVAVKQCSTGQPLSCTSMKAHLEITYVYLDLEERNRFACGRFQQLITQVQQFSTSGASGNIRAQLNFNNPTLQLIWMLQRKKNVDMNKTFDFSGFGGRDPMVSAALLLNNSSRFDKPAQYFRLVQPFQHHTNKPKSFIYSYSFALYPEEAHPSGSLNMSRIDTAVLNVTLQPELATEQVALYVFGRNWNILRFREGLGGVIFSS